MQRLSLMRKSFYGRGVAQSEEKELCGEGEKINIRRSELEALNDEIEADGMRNYSSVSKS